MALLIFQMECSLSHTAAGAAGHGRAGEAHALEVLNHGTPVTSLAGTHSCGADDARMGVLSIVVGYKRGCQQNNSRFLLLSKELVINGSTILIIN